MRYINKYTAPSHWKALSTNHCYRNKRSYIKNVLPGKPKSLSVPLWLLLKRYHNNPKYTGKVIKKLRSEVKINQRVVNDIRESVMTGQTVTIDKRCYRFLLFKTKAIKALNYKLQEAKSPTQTITKVRAMGTKTMVYCLNGYRKLVSASEIPPGSLLSGDKILPPTDVERVIPLTGRAKFKICEVDAISGNEFKLRDPQTGTIMVVKLSWAALEERKYLLL